MKKPTIEKATLTFQVMRVDGDRYFIGSHGVLAPVPDIAFGVIAELEVSMNEALKKQVKNKANDNSNNSNNDSSDSLSG